MHVQSATIYRLRAKGTLAMTKLDFQHDDCISRVALLGLQS